MKSLSFYATMLLVRLLGIKRIFSNDPLDYRALRARDVPVPTGRETLGLKTSAFKVMRSTVTEIAPETRRSQEIILYYPGGSFVSGPAKFNWRSAARIAEDTGRRAYLVDYPKAPEHGIEELNRNIDAVYESFLHRQDVSSIVLLGGSVGGTLTTLLVQRLVEVGRTLPRKMVLITPMMDADMSDPRVEGIERKDVMYTRPGVLRANQLCAGKTLTAISPLSGSCDGFPPTLVFIAEHDIQRPGAERFCDELRRRGEVRVKYGEGLPHIWPLLPMREGREALGMIADFIREES